MLAPALWLFAFAAAHADEPAAWTPLAIDVDCETEQRVLACTYVTGFVTNSPLYRHVPRSEAAVRVIVGATTQANDDRTLLRFVSTTPDWPASYEMVQTIDSRASVDEQIAALKPAFERGAAVYMGLVNPTAVTVHLAVPAGPAEVASHQSPWGNSTWLGGYGSHTKNYQSMSTWFGTSAYRKTDTHKSSFWVNGDFGLTREPSLDVEGHEVPLDTDSWDVKSALLLERHLDPHWSIGSITRGGKEDPAGQYAGSVREHLGLARDWFASNDERGNRLAVTALAGAQADWYNATNALQQDRAIFPSLGLMADGSIHQDDTQLSLGLSAFSELPLQRYVLEARGSVQVNVGDHLDLYMSMGVTQQAVPGPAELDRSSYEAVTRADYAEPLSLDGTLELDFHWDNTNGAVNNRFEGVSDLDSLGNL